MQDDGNIYHRVSSSPVCASVIDGPLNTKSWGFYLTAQCMEGSCVAQKCMILLVFVDCFALHVMGDQSILPLM